MWLVVLLVMFAAEVSQMTSFQDRFEQVIFATRGSAIVLQIAHILWTKFGPTGAVIAWNKEVTMLLWTLQAVILVCMSSHLYALDTRGMLEPLPVYGLGNVTSYAYSGATGIISMYCFALFCLFVQLAGLPPEWAFALCMSSLVLELALEGALSGRAVPVEMALVGFVYVLIPAGAAYTTEIDRRRLFASLILLNADAQRSQQLVNSMLPKCIVNALQQNSCASPGESSNLPRDRIVFQPPQVAAWTSRSPTVMSPGTGRFPVEMRPQNTSTICQDAKQLSAQPKLVMTAKVEDGGSAVGGRDTFTSAADPSRSSFRHSVAVAMQPPPRSGCSREQANTDSAQVAPVQSEAGKQRASLHGLGLWARQAAVQAISWFAGETNTLQPPDNGDGISEVIRLDIEHEQFLESVETAERRAPRRASVGSILEVASDGSQLFTPASSHAGLSIKSPLSPESVSGRPQHIHWGAGHTDGPQSVAFLYEHVSVCFVYVCGIAQLSSTCDPIQLVRALNTLYSAFDAIVRRCGAYKVMAIADMYIIVTGVPELGDSHHAKRLLDTVAAILQEANSSTHVLEETKLSVKIGLHCGSVAAGVIGMRTRNFHVFGDTVNFASRMCSTGEAGKIHCSKRFKEEVCREDRFIARKYAIIARGAIPVKGKGMQETFRCESKVLQPKIVSASVVRIDGFDSDLVDQEVASGPTSGGSSIAASPSSSASRTHNRSFLRTTLLIENMTNPSMRARRDLVAHLHTAQEHGNIQAEQPVHKAAARPSVFRLRAPEGKGRSVAPQRADHDHENFQNLIYVSMEPQSRCTRAFKSSRLEHLYSAVLRRAAWKQFAVLAVLVVVPSLLTGIFAASEAVTAVSPLRLAGHTTSLVLAVISVLAMTLGYAAYFRSWHVDVLYLHCVRLLAWSSVVCAASILMNSIALNVGLSISCLPISLAMVLVTQTVAQIETLLHTELSLFAGFIALLIYEAALGRVSAVETLAASVFVTTSLVVAALMGYGKDRAARRGFLTRLHTGTQNRQAKRLLRHMLPSPWHADSIMRGEPVVEFLHNVTLLYSDIVGYTVLSARLHPADLIRLLDRLYRSFDAHLDALGLYKVETIGDAFVVLGGVRRIDGTAESVSANYFSQNAWKSPHQHPGLHSVVQSPAALDVAYRKADSLAFNNRLAESGAAGASFESPSLANHHSSQPTDEQLLHPTTAVGIFAMRMLDNIQDCVSELGISFDMRIGIHVGSVVGGIVGTTRPRYFMWGFDTVIGNAMESEGVKGQIMLSQTAAVVMKNEGFQLDPGPTVTVQEKQIETSFLRSFQGKYIFRPDSSPPVISQAPMLPKHPRISTASEEGFGSAVGLERCAESIEEETIR